MLFACHILFTGALGLSFAIWATILLSRNGLQDGTSEVLFAYMITDCIIHYLHAIECVTGLRRLMEGKSPKVGGLTGCLGLGLLIWNIVLLFRDIGIDHISDNPYYMYVFVSFLVNMIVLGITLVMCGIAACCMGFAVFSDTSKKESKEPPKTPSVPPDPYNEV